MEDWGNIDFMEDWGNIDFFGDSKQETPKEDDKKKRSKRRRAACIERSDKHLYRRAYGESSLLNAMGMELKEGHSYHFITGGDVDALSYLKVVMKHQKTIDHLLFSTWCMAAEDVLAFDEWLTEGRIKKLDAYLGEIFPRSYSIEWKMINDIFAKHNCGRIAVFKNHSKIFAGTGKDFSFGIETSANINTNPRIENGCITISNEIYDFYKSYFDGIKTIVKDG